MKRALITGITGQDGPYLAAHLISLGYQVFGLVRGHDNPKLRGVREIVPDIEFVGGDLLDHVSLIRAVEQAAPDELYNLAAISAVPISWQQSELVSQINGLGVWRLLEALRITGRTRTRFFQASSAEVFGDVDRCPQDESTPIRPRNPYGIAKLYAHEVVRNYRDHFGMFAVNGILYPHESLRRSEEFVTRKITRAAARIKLGMQKELGIGNLQAQRDWGYAPDYVRAYHLMLQHDMPEDFVIGSGVMHTIEDVLRIAFSRVGLDWCEYVKVDPRFYRKPEQFPMRSDAGKAREKLGWEPRVTVEQMIQMMVDYDLNDLAGEGSAPVPGGLVESIA